MLVDTPTRRLRIAQRLLGNHTPAARRLWWRLRARTPWEPNRALRVANRFIKANGLTVRRGPFAGMRYPSAAVGSTVLVPKLLGSFELELRPVVEEIVQQRFPSIINIGCAEGYYAVGLARKLPDARVHAFDLDRSFRHLCAAMAELNNVDDRVTIYGAATSDQLQTLAQNERVVVFCDCEGCERELLDPSGIPSLRAASILVEMHDFIDRAISETLLRSFEQTHVIDVIGCSNRSPREYDELKAFPDEDAAVAVDEFRPEDMQWAWMRPRRHPPSRFDAT